MPTISLPLSRFLRREARIREQHRLLRSEFALYHDLYHKRHWASAPLDDADWQVVLPIHTLTVDTAHALITGMRPSPHVYPTGRGDRAQRRADDIEQWHLGVDAECSRARGRDLWAASGFDQAKFGLGVLREVYDFPPGWASGEVSWDDLDHFPIIQHDIDPRQVYFEFGDAPRGLFSAVFYECAMTLADLLALYPDAEFSSRYDEDGNILPQDLEEERTVIDWWEWIGGRLYNTVICEVVSPTSMERERGAVGQFLKAPTPMPEYWVIPYYIFPYRQTTSRRPEEWCLSVLYPLTDIPHYLEVLVSRQMRREEMYTDPQIITRRGANSPDAPIEYETGPGKVHDLLPGEDINYLQWNGGGPNTEQIWQKLDEIMHEVGFTRALLAQGSPDATGFRQALDRETSILKISKGLQSWQDAHATVYKARSYALGKLSPDTAVPTISIDKEGEAVSLAVTGKRLAQHMNLTVEAKPNFPSDMQRNMAVAQSALAAKIWSIDDAMEYAPPPNGGSKDATRQKVVGDAIEFHPEVQAARARQVAAAIDLETQEMMARSQPPQPLAGAIAGPPGMGPPPGAPGLPGTPGSPGQPAGASGMTPQTAGVDNRLRGAFGSATGQAPTSPVPGPQSIPDAILRAGRK